MKVVCLNTWGGRLEKELFNYLRHSNADVFCLQELFSGSQVKPQQKRFKDDDGHSVNLRLFEDIAAILPNHTGYFSGGSKGYVNDSQWVDLPFEYGIGVFIHKNIKVNEYLTGIAFGSYRSSGTGKPPLPRPAQIMRISLNSESYTFGNIHGLWESKGKMDTRKRKNQADNFGRLFDSTAEEDDGLFVCGDFNLLKNSNMFINSKFNLKRNLILEKGITSTRTSIYKKENRFADYVISNESIDFLNLRVPQKPIVSDHCPLEFEIRQHELAMMDRAFENKGSMYR